MKRFDRSIALSGLFSGENRKLTTVLLLTPILITTWRYYGTKTFYLSHLSSSLTLCGSPDRPGANFSFLTALLLFGLIPALVIRFVFHEPLSKYGLQVGDWRFGLFAALAMTPVMIALTYPLARDPHFLAEYPVFKGAGASSVIFAAHCACYLGYYAGYEILTRGFLQFGLRERFGDWGAILVQTTVSCLFHIGKPSGEIYTSILGGLIWGIVVFRSRSLIYVLLVHWLLGVSLDFFICFS